MAGPVITGQLVPSPAWSATTLSALNAETVLASGTGLSPGGLFQAQLDLSNMAAGDVLEVRIYNQANAAASLVQQEYMVFVGAQSDLMRQLPAVPGLAGWKVTIKQTAGTPRRYPWSVLNLYGGETIAAFAGLVDIYGAAVAVWSLRAASAANAAAGSKAIQLQRASDNATQDITVLSSGDLDLATATSFLSGTTGGISIWYDQSGNGYHMVQATQALQPQFAFNAIGSRPGVTFNGNGTSSGPFLQYSAGIPNVNPPVTFSLALYPITPPSGLGCPLDSVNGGDQGWQIEGGVSSYLADFTTLNYIASPGSVWHAVQTVAAIGTNAGNYFIDGVSSPQTFALTSGSIIVGGQNTIGIDTSGSAYFDSFDGVIEEIAIFNVAGTSAQLINANTNQHNYWGF